MPTFRFLFRLLVLVDSSARGRRKPFQFKSRKGREGKGMK
jgi:hypothetical protein